MKKYDSSYSIALAILEKMQGGGGGGDCKFTVDITAPDVGGSTTTTKVNYTAKLEGKDGNGAPATGIVAEGQGISDDFGVNPSTTESRQVPVTFTYLGYTAKTVITQDKYVDRSDVFGSYFYYDKDEEAKIKEYVDAKKFIGYKSGRMKIWTWEDIISKNNAVKNNFPDGWAPKHLSDENFEMYEDRCDDPLRNYFVDDNILFPHFDFSNVSNNIILNTMLQCDGGGTKTHYNYVPDMNCANIKSMWNLFYGQRLLVHVGIIDCSGVDENIGNIDAMFYDCIRLEYIGGLHNVHMTTRLADSTKLTRESVLNIFNSMGECTSPTRNTWTFAQQVYDLLTPEDIKIATDKGYNVAAE